MGMTTFDVKIIPNHSEDFHGSNYNDNCFMATMKSMYNFHLIHDDNYSDLSSYFKVFENKYEVVERTVWIFVIEAVPDIYLL